MSLTKDTNVASDFEDAISYSSTMSAVGKARSLGGIPKMANSNQQLQKAIYLDQCSHIYSRECRDVSQIQRWILSTNIRCFF